MRPGLVAEGMEERVDDQVAVALAQVGEVAPLRVHPKIWQWFIITPLGRPVVPDV